MNKINFYKHIIICIIIIYDIGLVSSGDPDPNEGEQRERLRLKRPASPQYGSYGNKRLVEVDINAERSTREYYYSKTRLFIMFTPKNGYIFGSAREGTCDHCGFSNRVIWVAKDHNELSNKIVLPLKRNGVRVDYTCIKMVVYQENGLRRFFSKRPRFASMFNHYWMEKIYNTPEVERPPHLEIITADDLNGTNPVVNDNTKFAVSKNVIESDIFEIVYHFPNSSNCMEVRYMNETVWRYDPKYLTLWKIYFIPGERLIMLSYNEENYYCFRIPN